MIPLPVRKRSASENGRWDQQDHDFISSFSCMRKTIYLLDVGDLDF
jgi:hypothetical protein